MSARKVEDLQQRLFHKDVQITALLDEVKRLRNERGHVLFPLLEVAAKAREHYTAMAIVAYEDQPTKDDHFRAQLAHDRLHAALQRLDQK